MYNPKISIFKDLLESKDVPYIVTLSQCIERIRVGKSKELIKKIRSADKQTQRDLKMKLPSIVFAGEFSERNSKGLKNHSGLMVVDFDKYPDSQTMASHYLELKTNPHFITLFISPSGEGIKGVVRIPKETDKETHPKYFKAFQKKFKFDYFDMANSDCSRVCFESYDPDIYVNDEATIFETELIDEGHSVAERVPLIPINDEEVIVKRIMDWQWSKSYTEGERNAYVFDVAGAFCEFGVSEASAITYIQNHIVTDDFSVRELHNTVKSAYKTRSFGTKYFEDYKKIDRVKLDLKQGREAVIAKYDIDQDTYDRIKEVNDEDDFWYYVQRKNHTEAKINEVKVRRFLKSKGFFKYIPEGSSNSIFVRVIENRVEQISAETIQTFMVNYVDDDRGEYDVLRVLLKNPGMFTEKSIQGMLREIKIQQLRDTKDTCFFSYRNGIVCVTKEGVTMTQYIDAEGYIWKEQIIDRDFKIGNTDEDCDYKEFIFRIANEQSLPLECTIGYLLSTFKNRMNNKAVILNDEIISENPEGGTGKGLFTQGLQHIRTLSTIDGKLYDDSKSFPFQTVSVSTNILLFDDVKKNFNFETKFSIVTEGITLERKNKDAIRIPVEESPKLLITTNYAVKGVGNSHDRRRHEIELSQYYNKDNTPMDEFGRQLFADWDATDWAKFDTYMMGCVRKYLEHDLIEQDAKNIRTRKFIAETSMEFYEWMDDDKNVGRNCTVSKPESFNNFVDEYPDFKKWLARKTYNTWIKKYCTFVGAEYEEYNSGGIRKFAIKTEKKIIEQIDDLPF